MSPHGRGHALLLLQSPQEAHPRAERANYCLHDNKGLASLGSLIYRRLDSVEASGDPASVYTETVQAGDLNVRLTWSGLGEPFCFALPPEKSTTGTHHMPSLFVGWETATIAVNGRALPAQPAPREIAGRTITKAMLAFSETWIRAD